MYPETKQTLKDLTQKAQQAKMQINALAELSDGDLNRFHQASSHLEEIEAFLITALGEGTTPPLTLAEETYTLRCAADYLNLVALPRINAIADQVGHRRRLAA